MSLNQSGLPSRAASPSDPPLDLSNLSSNERRTLLIRASWSSLKLRLRTHTLNLRSEGNHLITFLTESDCASAGTLDIDEIVTILETLEFQFLTPEEVDSMHSSHEGLVDRSLFEDRTVILKRFGDFRGNVNYRKLYDSLGLDPPSDHLDPDLFQDPLPQPYRLIQKTLFSILDDTWDVICSRHPTLRELPIENPQMYGLGEKRKVGEVKEAKHASPSGVLGSYGTVTCTSWSLAGNMLGCGTASGHFVLLNPASSAPVDAPSAFLPNSGFNLGASAATASSCILGNCGVFTDIPFGVSHISTPARPKGGQLRCVRVALAAPFKLQEIEDDAVEDTGGKKGKGKKKGKKEEEEQGGEVEEGEKKEQPMISKLAIVECWQTLGGEGGKVRISE